MSTQLELYIVWRRLRWIIAGALVILASMLLFEHRVRLAIGLSSGLLIALLNVRLLIRHIEQSSTYPPRHAAIIVQRGMVIRFTIIVLSSIVVIDRTSLESMVGFILGLLGTLLLSVAMAAQIALRQTPVTEGVQSGIESRRTAPQVIQKAQR